VELYESFVGIRMGDPMACAGLVEALRAEPWTRAVWTRDELYEGPFLATRIPDLVIELDEDVAAAAGVGAGPIVDAVPPEEIARWPATHRRAGIAVGAGPGVRAVAPEEAGVEDVVATALAIAGVPLPDDLDGRVWTESIEASPTFVQRGPRPPPRRGGKGSDGSLERSLRKLGYLR